ncbi:ATP-dependent DNA helicase [Dendrothele bispora CBS 962.96]|uniref:ATP-dependent DNA helicase n=1 Tax=Dendrothele bispora (strain CBS 962.96) TaxID=1314807 RepID=A0A4S8LNQ8_DENBC|nr:ATP-dependent DNA helicase [Dendrothele bispora CBS 962.96]
MSFSEDEDILPNESTKSVDIEKSAHWGDWPDTIEQPQAGPSQTRTHENLEARIAVCHRILRESKVLWVMRSELVLMAKWTVFGHSSYKGKQKEIVEAAVSGLDVLVLAPTGMGKSLCFQLPAASEKSGVTVVISPLLEVAALRRKGICTYALTSETPKETRQEVFEDLNSDNPKIRLLYTTPERLVTSEFMGLLGNMYDKETLNRLVVDEAHCISEWGHDFREEFRRIGAVRDKFPEVPIMALTATATPDVQKDIIRSLRMAEHNLFKAIHPFNRANLYYEIRYTGSTSQLSLMTEICDYVLTLHQKRGKPSSGIIYCRTRKTCDELADFLRRKGLSARPYHRGLPSSQLEKTLKDWTVEGGSTSGGIDVVVATIAFGLGIDKGDVRYVIHYDVPKSLEGYYQETGRAGRNGSPSKCILYYSREDVAYAKRLVSQNQNKRFEIAEQNKGPVPSQRSISSLNALVKMAENARLCRHVSICRYFGEIINADDPEVLKSLCDNMCDVCKYPEKTWRRKDKLSPAEYAASQVESWHMANDDEDHCQRPPLVSRTSGTATAATAGEFGRSGRLADKAGSGSYFGTATSLKRGGTALVGGGSANAKKAKVTYGFPTLVTRPFKSAPTLVKPFKPPSLVKTSSKSSENSSVPSSPPSQPRKGTLQAMQERTSVVERERELERDASPVYDIQMQGHERADTPASTSDAEEGQVEVATSRSRSLSPELDLPDVFVELEQPDSQKVDPTRRRSGMNTIRIALHKVFKKNPDLWSRINRAPSSTEKRNRLVDLTAKEVEYESVLCFCCTFEGYRIRLNATVESVKLLTCEEAWDATASTKLATLQNEEFEDAREIVGVLKRTCRTG